jgi:hypothetical protein
MADRNALGMIGFVLSGAALTVVTIAYMVVRDHVDGRLMLGADTSAVYQTSLHTPAAQR